MKLATSLISGILIVVLAACDLGDGGQGIHIFSFEYDFEDSTQGWTHGFADYPAGPDDSTFYELQYEHATCPAGGGKAIMLSGNNHSDDLFMYIKRNITGLRPDADYTLTFELEMASNAPHGSVGTGGSPGESVFVKVGATAIEPRSVVENGKFVMNIDKGNQAEGGEDMVVIGDIATDAPTAVYSLINRKNSPPATSTPLIGRTNSQGELWLIVGTDSGYEGITKLYYTHIFVVLSEPN